MITFRGNNYFLSLRDLRLNEIEGDILHVGGFNLLDNLREDICKIFKLGKNRGMLTSLDPNWDPKGWCKRRINELKKVLKVTDIFFPDYEEGKAITKLKEPKEIIKKLLDFGATIVALKCGKNGSYVNFRGKIYHVKSLSIKPRFTTGAGDAFDAGFLKKFLEKGNSLEACKFANKIAARYILKGFKGLMS